MNNTFKVETRRVPVTVMRECMLVAEEDVFVVDEHTNRETGGESMLIWHTDSDKMAVGIGFRGWVEDNAYLAFDHVDVMDKRSALKIWVEAVC